VCGGGGGGKEGGEGFCGRCEERSCHIKKDIPLDEGIV